MLRHFDSMKCSDLIPDAGCDKGDFIDWEQMKYHLEEDHQIDIYGTDVVLKKEYQTKQANKTRYWKVQNHESFRQAI